MKRMMALGVALAGGLWTSAASAADIKVVVGGALNSTVQALAPLVEKNGDHLVIEEGTGAILADQLAKGESFDVALLPAGGLDVVEKAGKIAPGTRKPAGKIGVGVSVKAGAPRPDISTTEALRKTLLSVKSLAYSDPKTGASSGVAVQSVIDKLGLEDQIRSKAVLVKGRPVGELVASGEVELGLQQLSELMVVKGITIVGPLPAAQQTYTRFDAGLSAAGAQSKGAQEFMRLLTGAAGAAAMKPRGVDPGA